MSTSKRKKLNCIYCPSHNNPSSQIPKKKTIIFKNNRTCHRVRPKKHISKIRIKTYN